MKPDVDVIIPSYNGKTRGFLGAAIDSALGQTLRPKVVMVIDDGSTDGTADWVRQKYKDVQVLSFPNGGLSSARNRGVAETHSPYLAFLDDDDVWQADKLEKQFAALSAHPDWLAVLSAMQLIDANGKPIRIIPRVVDTITWPQSLLGNFFPPSTLLLGRKTFERLGGFKLAYKVEDLEFYLRLSKLGTIGILEEPLLKYRRHQSNMISQTDEMNHWVLKVMSENREGAPAALYARARNYFLFGALIRSVLARKPEVSSWCLRELSAPRYPSDALLRFIAIGLRRFPKLQTQVMRWELKRIFSA